MQAAFKIILETPELALRAVNDLNDADDLAYLLNYDTVYGRYHEKVVPVPAGLKIKETTYPVFKEKDPGRLPWKKLEIDIVLECTGMFNQQADLERHLAAGAKTVIRQRPGDCDHGPSGEHGKRTDDRDHLLRQLHHDCIAPVVEVMGRRIGVEKAIMTTVHAYTATQATVDRPNRKRRRGRAAAAM